MDFETIMELPHAIGLQGVENDRDLGGYVNRQGKKIRMKKLLRTGRLANLTNQDIQTLSEEYHLGTIIDFRTSSEVLRNPDIEIPETKYVHINLFPERATDTTKGSEVLHSMDEFEHAYQICKQSIELESFYISIMQRDIAKNGYRQFFDELLQLPEDQSLLFHCTAGKDRTGMAAAFLLAVLGFDRQTLMEDYLLTNDFCMEKIDQMVNRLNQIDNSPDMERKIRSMFGVLPEIMSAFFDECESKYGTIENYVKEYIGVSEEEIEILKEKFLI